MLLAINPAALLAQTEGLTGALLHVSSPALSEPRTLVGTATELRSARLEAVAAAAGLQVVDPDVATLATILQVARPLQA